MKKRVAIALSGGVDSSVAAALLKKQGFEVIGITIYFGYFSSKIVKEAAQIARLLGLKHHVVDFSSLLEEKVINNFCQEYLKGRTPNPCIRCNQYIKFGALLAKAYAYDCQFLATGHYVRKIKTRHGFLLKKGKDKFKDQSYFLYRLKQEQLKHLLFPLGDLTKFKVNKIAGDLGLGIAKRKESQEICFLSTRNNEYHRFLKRRIGGKLSPGLIVDKRGNVLGKQAGVCFYTIGQRQGLNLALGYRAYVIKIDALKKRIIVGRRKDAYAQEFIASHPSFILSSKKSVVCKVKIRYNQKEKEAKILPERERVRVRFKQAQFGVTPGQAAVFYNNDIVIGGGIIERTIQE